MSGMTLGVVGTVVRDRIVPFDGDAVEDWGGIVYSLCAFAATVPTGWRVRPIVKVGADLSDEVHALLQDILPGLDSRGLRAVREPNNRVELRYSSPDERTERLEGGVPGWGAEELLDAVAGCDALYVNYVSGFETTLEVARELGARFSGPTHGDLHSLCLGVAVDGTRVWEPPPGGAAWLDCFDTVQMNERELGLVAGRRDPWSVLRRAMEGRLSLAVVTLGARGVAYLPRDAAEPTIAATSAATGDPTGCGDVWGATFFARSLAGDRVGDAVAAAHRAAGRALTVTGTRNLTPTLAERSTAWT